LNFLLIWNLDCSLEHEIPFTINFWNKSHSLIDYSFPTKNLEVIVNPIKSIKTQCTTGTNRPKGLQQFMPSNSLKSTNFYLLSLSGQEDYSTREKSQFISFLLSIWSNGVFWKKNNCTSDFAQTLCSFSHIYNWHSIMIEWVNILNFCELKFQTANKNLINFKET